MRQPGADARGYRADGGGAAVRGTDPGGDRGTDPGGDRTSAAGAGGVPEPRRAGEEPPQARPRRPEAPPESAGPPDPGEPPEPREPPEPAATPERAGTAEQDDRHPRLPPGQYVQATMPVLHYGPVPACNPQTWDLRAYGATEAGRERRWDWDAFMALPRIEIIADFHCVTKFSVLGITWLGVPAAELLRALPPSAAATHVMIWADFGYGANLPLDAFAADHTLLATHRDGRELAPEQGHPVRLVVPSRYGWKNVKWVRAIEYLAADRRGFWEERGYHNNADPWREQRYSYQELPGEGPEL